MATQLVLLVAPPQLPSSWPATLHVARWPELMPFLTPDWPERLASLPPQWPELVKVGPAGLGLGGVGWRDMAVHDPWASLCYGHANSALWGCKSCTWTHSFDAVHDGHRLSCAVIAPADLRLPQGLPPSWPEDFRAFVERRTAVGGAQQRATQTDGDAVGSALPPVHSPRARLRSTGVQVEAPGALAAAAAATACEAQVQAKALAQKPGSLGFSLDSLVPLSLLSECSELLPAELSAGADAVAIVQQVSHYWWAP